MKRENLAQREKLKQHETRLSGRNKPEKHISCFRERHVHTPEIWKWSPRGAHTPGAIAETRILQRCNHQGRKQAASRIKKSVDYWRVGGRVEGMRHANQAEAMPRETLWSWNRRGGSWNLNLREELGWPPCAWVNTYRFPIIHCSAGSESAALSLRTSLTFA